MCPELKSSKHRGVGLALEEGWGGNEVGAPGDWGSQYREHSALYRVPLKDTLSRQKPIRLPWTLGHPQTPTHRNFSSQITPFQEAQRQPIPVQGVAQLCPAPGFQERTFNNLGSK